MPGKMMPEGIMKIAWYTIGWMMTEAIMTISDSTEMIDGVTREVST